MSTWDQRFLDLAATVAQWSKDPSTKVGAVVVDSRNRVVSTGFNGPPRGVSDTFKDREEKLLKTIHAEVNAVIFSEGGAEGCRIYVTHPPCPACSIVLIQAGVIEVHYRAPSDEFKSRWVHLTSVADALMAEAGIKVLEW